MTKRLAIAAISFCVGACASSGPEIPAAAATAAPERVEHVVAATEDEGLHMLEAAPVQAVNVVPMYDPDQIVCQKVRKTGTKFIKKICRSRAEMDAIAKQAQDWWDQQRVVR